MRKKLTARLVAGLEPEAKMLEVHDSDVPGFHLRVWPSGRKVYGVLYRTDAGKRVRLTIGQASVLSVPQARDVARKTLNKLAHGEDASEEKRKAKGVTTLRKFLDGHYAPWAEANLRSGPGAVQRIRASFAGLLDKPIQAINPWLIERWRAKRSKERGCSSSTLNRDTGTLKAAIGKAVKWGMVSSNPLKGCELRREDPCPVVRYLEAAERERLLAALDARQERIRAERDSANAWRAERGYAERTDLRTVTYADYLKPLVLLALNTGMRKGEIFSLEWADVDLKRATLAVRGATAKSGKTRHIALNATIREVLTGWREQTGGKGLVFPSPATGGRLDNIRRSWAALLKEAQITGFRFHDMRHDFASQLVMKGIDLNTVRELLGHASLRTTTRYVHLTPAVKAAAVAVLDSLDAAPANVIALKTQRSEA